MTKIVVTTPFIKLDSFLKLSGAVGTGGEAKIRVKSGDVLVDGEPCTMRGKKLYPGARVKLAGEEYLVVDASGAS